MVMRASFRRGVIVLGCARRVRSHAVRQTSRHGHSVYIVTPPPPPDFPSDHAPPLGTHAKKGVSLSTRVLGWYSDGSCGRRYSMASFTRAHAQVCCIHARAAVFVSEPKAQSRKPTLSEDFVQGYDNDTNVHFAFGVVCVGTTVRSICSSARAFLNIYK